MADYNVQMKQYNGTSFDNILPHAYLADRATDADHATSADSANTATELAGGGGATEIITTARSGLSQIATGSYVGNGTVGESNAITIQCGFKPKFLWVTTTRTPPFSRGKKYDIHNSMQSPSGVVNTNSYFNSSGVWIESESNKMPVYVSYGNDSMSLTQINRVFQPMQDGIKFYAEKTNIGSGASLELTSEMQLNNSGTYYYWVAIGDVTT